MRLAIVGSRTFDDYDIFLQYIEKFLQLHYGNHTVISGGAKGADRLAKIFAQTWEREYIEFPADWNKYGKQAGFIRNQQIVDAADMILAFWDGKSRGTKDTIDKARRAKKPTFIVYF